MALRYLSVAGLRNLAEARLDFDAQCNVIVGKNAAGKTSLLEAIHVLARARSFRATRLDRVRRDGRAALRVHGEVRDRMQSHRIGVGRDDDGTRVRVDGADARGLSELARLVPIQVLNTESQRLLQDGPETRRSFMNWTLFHVEHDFHATWRRFDRALRQRNAALREGQDRLAASLEPEFVASGESIDGMRRRMLDALESRVQVRLDEWLGDVSVRFRYRQGWARDKGLTEALADQKMSEQTMGYTMVGPQRAELQILAEGMDARDRLSRGQQKVLVIAMLLAQADVIAATDGPSPVFLVDDLAAELDAGYREGVVTSLLGGTGQCFFTAIDADTLPVSGGRTFHVEQGRVTEMIY